MREYDSEISWRPFGWSLPRLLLVGLVASLLIVVLLTATTSTAGFSPYNADWDGTGEFRTLAAQNSELTVATNTSQYQQSEPSATVAFAFAIDRNYSTSDAERIRRFVSNGGTLVVADNFGSHGNRLLSAIGARARFDGRVLRDERNNFRSPLTPVVGDTSNHSLVSDVNSLTLNYGSVIEPRGATPLLNSSEFSYVVTDPNGTVTDADDLQRYPIVTVEGIENGEVIAIGDPSLFINSMLRESDNKQFAGNLIGQGTHTLVDVSHSSNIPPLVFALLELRSSPVLSAGMLILLIGSIAIIDRYSDIKEQPLKIVSDNKIGLRMGTDESQAASEIESQSPKADPQALKRELRKRHPDWDEERLDTVITGVLPYSEEELTNE